MKTTPMGSRGFPWRIACGAFGIVGVAYAIAFLGLQLAGVRPSPGWIRDLSAGFVLAVLLAVLVARTAKRHGEKAHPWGVFLAVWSCSMLLGCLADLMKDRP